MTYPEGYEFDFPGIYSLSISYGVYNSFYFSQYIGLGLINFLEFKDMKQRALSYAMALTLFCLTMMLIFTRGHYSIDIFGGFIFGHYFWMMAERVSWIIDYGLMKIPFHKRFPHFTTKCFACKAPINKWATILFEEMKIGSPKIDEEMPARPKRSSPNSEQKKSLTEKIEQPLGNIVEEEETEQFYYQDMAQSNNRANSGRNVVNNTLSTGGIISPPDF